MSPSYPVTLLWPLLLTWFNFNLSMDKQLQAQLSVGWNYLHHWSLGMDKELHPTHYNGCNYLSMLGLKLIHVSKSGPWGCRADGTEWMCIPSCSSTIWCINPVPRVWDQSAASPPRFMYIMFHGGINAGVVGGSGGDVGFPHEHWWRNRASSLVVITGTNIHVPFHLC